MRGSLPRIFLCMDASIDGFVTTPEKSLPVMSNSPRLSPY